MADLKDLLVNGQTRLVGDANYKTHAAGTKDDRLASTKFVDTAINNASSNYKKVQTAVVDPTASGSASAFIDSISQDTQGKITVTKKNVNFPTLSLSTHGSGNAITSVSVNGHTIDVSYGQSFSTTGHNHDGVYSTVGHNHDSSYASKSHSLSLTTHGTGNAITTISVSSHSIDVSFGATYLTTVSIPDVTVSIKGTGNAISTMSASGHTITATLASFATSGHNHDGVYIKTETTLSTTSAAGSGTTALTSISVNGHQIKTYTASFATSGHALSTASAAGSGSTALTSISVNGHEIKTYTASFATSDTKNTAGATASVNTKLFLVGAPAQVTSTVTYTNASVYIASDNTLYSGGKQVLTSGDLPTNSKIQQATLSFNIPDSSKISGIAQNPNGEITVTTTAAPWLLPGDIAGGVQYKGDVNANTLVISSGDASLNGKTLTAAKEESGYMFTVNTAGTIAGQAMEVGDSIIFKKNVSAGTAVAATDITYVEASVSVTQYNSPSMQWGTDTSIITVDGVTAKAKTPSTMIGWRLQGSGINSLMNSPVGTGINPAVNGLGYNTKVGKTVTNKDGAQAKIFMTRGGVEFEFTNPDGYINQTILQYLFDGRNSTSIQLTVPSIFLSSTGLAEYNYSATKAYAVGDFVRYMTANIKSNGDSDYAWYRCIQATTGNAPSGVVETGNTYWEYMSGLKPSYYTGINPSKLTQLRVRLYLTSSIAYENGISVYWRTNGQHPTYMKLQKIKGDESGPNGGFMYPTSDIGASTDGNISNQTVSSVYFSQGASAADDNKIIDFIFTGLSGNSTWACVPTQFAFTGNCGSLEGTLVNRGGGTGASMYGDFLPYKTDTLNLGNSSYRWNNIQVKNINGATATWSSPTHTHSVTVSGTHKHNIPTISGGSHKHTFSIANTVTNHSHSVNDPAHSHSFSGSASHKHNIPTISGGSHKHAFSLTTTQTSHSHSINDPAHSHSFSGSASHKHNIPTISGGSHKHAFSIANTATNHSHSVNDPAHSHAFNASDTHKHNIPTISGGSHKHAFSIANSVTNHSHSVNDPGHTHSVSLTGVGSHKHNIPTISGGSHKHAFSIANTATNHSHSVNDPGHTHSFSGSASHSHSYNVYSYSYDTATENITLALTAATTSNVAVSISGNTGSKTAGITLSASSFSISNASTGETSITINNISTGETSISISGNTGSKTTGVTLSASSFSVTNASTGETGITINNVSTGNATINIAGSTDTANTGITLSASSFSITNASTGETSIIINNVSTGDTTVTISGTSGTASTGITTSAGGFAVTNASTGNTSITINNVSTGDTTVTISGTSGTASAGITLSASSFSITNASTGETSITINNVSTGDTTTTLTGTTSAPQ